jgi:hypothetical protein
MDGTIEVSAPNLAPEQLQDISSSLLKDLVVELGLNARFTTEAGKLGDKGDPITIGAIIVSLANSGAILGVVPGSSPIITTHLFDGDVDLRDRTES